MLTKQENRIGSFFEEHFEPIEDPGEDNLQYNRARHFDPACGRWISDDPIGFAGGDEKLTRYVDAPAEPEK